MNNKAKKIALTGVLAALSFILYIFPHFPILPPPFTNVFKMDFADLPALIVSATVSPILGAVVVFIRNLLHYVFFPDPFFLWIGEFSNFIVSSLFVLVAGWLFRKANSMKNIKIIAVNSIISTVLAVAVAVLSNYFIILNLIAFLISPELVNGLGGAANYIVAGVIPFNIIKSAVNILIFAVIYKNLKTRIKSFKL
ncbi:MAG: ECF transporter S component [Clostridia bacterium]|nr:ECF transporter S component [Clostridia bacterium]